MTPMARMALAGTALALVAAPILAQRGAGREGGNRPSRECAREIVQLCGRNREQIPACLAEQAAALSEKCRGELGQRLADRQGETAAPRIFMPTARPTRTVLYGSHQRQAIDIYEPEGVVEAKPLVLFIHGGGWRMGNRNLVQIKPRHFGAQEIYFASTGYRLLPDTPVEDQARDVGAAVQALVGQAGTIGFDASRLVLMGHSAGAHLAALVATDPQYAGEAFGAIRGVVLLDGAGYDVAQNMEDADYQARRIYEDAFGFDVERQKALSPVTHVGGPDAPNWLALYVEDRAIAGAQSRLLVDGLVAAGRSAKAVPIPDTDHGRMNREIGAPGGAAQTQAIDAFLADILD